MEHAERLPAILGSWHGLQPGQVLRITVDHNPMPLQYLFQAESPGQFRWEYEKQGPEWIVRISKVAAAQASTDKEREALRDVMSRLAAGEEAAVVKEQAKDLLRKVDASKLAMLEQEMVGQGVGREDMRRLCDVHLEVMKETLETQLVAPEPGHPIHTLMEEHKVLKRQLEELRGHIEAMKQATELAQVAGELEAARGVAHHLTEAERHHQREEQVIFPALEQRGVSEPPAIMREEHEELRAKKHELARLVETPADYTYSDWVQDVERAGGYLVRELGNHIYKEDNILYQAALQVIEPEAWGEMEKRCDEIGYCCFTPGVGVTH